MYNLLWLIPVLPLMGFLILLFGGRSIPRSMQAVVGVGSIGLSAIITLVIGIMYLLSPPAGGVFTQELWTWMQVEGFRPSIAFRLDALTLVFLFVITFVGFWIHLYSAEFMKEDPGHSRFFSYMNLFVSSMLILVMADNLLLLYLGWEGVGLCSYLLIGFWYRDPANGRAAQKAFIVTRIGDTAMAIALFMLFFGSGTLHIQSILDATWQEGSTYLTAITLLLLGGAVGKSAQLPLQTWLPDAMAGPSPVSALIHAATMVTAGVYLIARLHGLFEMTPQVMTLIAVIGAATLLLAGFSALAQRDIKRVLAYSTISQIGYMFLALGVGAWSAAVFHFMIHAFFKALLFLGAGAIILVLHHEHDMFKMGGLRKQLPVTFWTFLVASASLAAIPLVTAGFYSKDLILWYSWSAGNGDFWLWIAGLTGAFITALYTFRMIFITFFGEAHAQVTHKPGNLIKIPLIVLGILSLLGGLIELPHNLAHVTLFSDLVNRVLPETTMNTANLPPEWMAQLAAAAASIGGLLLAYLFFYPGRKTSMSFQRSGIANYWMQGWAFDRMYDALFVRPFVWISSVNRDDVVDKLYDGIASLTRSSHSALILTQSGKLRWYAIGVVLGTVITTTIIILL